MTLALPSQEQSEEQTQRVARSSCSPLLAGRQAGPSVGGGARHASGCETNRSIPSCCDRNADTSCPLTLFPARSSGGAKVPSPPLPGDTVTIPPPIPLLPGRPMSKSQSPEVSYRPAVAITASA